MHFRTLIWVMAVAYPFLIAGCSDDNSSSSTEGKWLEAPTALTMFLTNTELMMSGRDKEGCPVVIDHVREVLNDPQNFGTMALLKQCSDASMAFGEEVRCKGKRLQVKCN